MDTHKRAKLNLKWTWGLFFKLTLVGQSGFFNIIFGQINVKKSNEKNVLYNFNFTCFYVSTDDGHVLIQPQ